MTNKEMLDLVNDAKNGNSKSLNKLLGSFSPLIWTYTNQLYFKYPHIPLEKSDIKQELTVSFWKLVNKFDEKYGKSFPAYIKQYLIWSGHTEMKRYINKSMMVMNYYENAIDDNKMIHNQDFDKFDDFENFLSKKEYKVLKMTFEDHMSPLEICNELSSTIASVYQAKKRGLERLKQQKEIVGLI